MIVPHIIREFVADQVLGQIEYSYVYIRSYGFFPGAVMLVFNAYFLARGNTKIVLLGAVTMAISNVLLDYLLINGNHGFPEMGASGAAVASLCSDWIGMVFMTIAFVTGRYVLQQTILHRTAFGYAIHRFCLPLYKSLEFRHLLDLVRRIYLLCNNGGSCTCLPLFF